MVLPHMHGGFDLLMTSPIGAAAALLSCAAIAQASLHGGEECCLPSMVAVGCRLSLFANVSSMRPLTLVVGPQIFMIAQPLFVEETLHCAQGCV